MEKFNFEKDLDSTRAKNAILYVAVNMTPHINNILLQEYEQVELPIQEAITLDHNNDNVTILQPYYEPEYN